MVARRDRGPALRLGGGGRGEARLEPGPDRRGEAVEAHGANRTATRGQGLRPRSRPPIGCPYAPCPIGARVRRRRPRARDGRARVRAGVAEPEPGRRAARPDRALRRGPGAPGRRGGRGGGPARGRGRRRRGPRRRGGGRRADRRHRAGERQRREHQRPGDRRAERADPRRRHRARPDPDRRGRADRGERSRRAPRSPSGRPSISSGPSPRGSRSRSRRWCSARCSC